MRLQLSPEEQDAFRSLADSHEGRVLQGFVQRMIASVESVRTKTDLSEKERCAVADFLEENFITRMKVLRGEAETPDADEWE